MKRGLQGWARGSTRWFLLVLALLASGCLGRSPDVRLFTLGTLAPVEEANLAPERAVLIGPVRLPAYLERPQIARLRSYGEIELDQFDRWVGGFEKNLIRAVEFGVRRRLGSDRVVGYPSGAPFPFDHQVRIHVDEMIVDTSGAANVLRVRIRWAMVSPGSGGDSNARVPSSPIPSLSSEPGTSLFEDTIPVRDDSVEALVEAHDAALSQLAQRISDQIAAR